MYVAQWVGEAVWTEMRHLGQVAAGQPAVTSMGGGIAEDPADPGGLDLPTPRCLRRIMV